MPVSTAVNVFRVIQRDGPGNRLILRRQTDHGDQSWVIAGYRGPELPPRLTAPALVPDGEVVNTWRLTCAEGVFDFQAAALDYLEEQPALFSPLHREFALKAIDRIAVRVLLWLLRLPGGARLLRRWHSQRS